VRQLTGAEGSLGQYKAEHLQWAVVMLSAFSTGHLSVPFSGL
jgi:hypothetical protein